MVSMVTIATIAATETIATTETIEATESSNQKRYHFLTYVKYKSFFVL